MGFLYVMSKCRSQIKKNILCNVTRFAPTYRYRDVQSSAKNKHETNAMQ